MNDLTGPPGLTDAARRKQWEDAWAYLGSVRSTLADLLAEAREADSGSMRETISKISQLESALKTAFETERKFHDWLSKQSGDLAAGEIDLDAARHRIGCRLDRLRACCREG
ncbi:hypothetical protein [Limimaricola pyoseonensis]|uniref:Uncharacterized protein n=1 Tax=Limimaricola pyoseonensis TaxID=521013 RepID=A0A1G7AXA9_9RHOB|nr:hypothetical protein [Limimaricola pyoseonensis]SDE19518.1 hypothetical protein SAMN04488567_1151 [Limimaricola pyoseonensis]